MMDQKSGGSATVRKCFQVLQVITDHLRREKQSLAAMRLRDIARATQFDQATTYRYLQSLEQFGLVQRDDDGRYRLGPKIVELHSAFIENNSLRSVAYEHMLALAEDTGETVYLGLLDGEEVFYIEKVDSSLPIRPYTPIGGRNRLYCTGLGKAMLAVANADLVQTVIAGSLQAFTENTLVDVDQLKEDLEATRSRGYSIDNMENEPEVRCVAAPIFDRHGHVFAALSVSGPAFRMTEAVIPVFGSLVAQAARNISKQLGDPAQAYSSQPHG